MLSRFRVERDSWSPEQGGYHFGHGDYDIAKISASNLNGSGEAVDAHLTYLKVVANDLWDQLRETANSAATA
ncbi:MAG: hypothetical protein WA624_24285 [Methylocella sp.]